MENMKKTKVYTESIEESKFSKKELLEINSKYDYKKETRELKIKRAKALLLRNQTIKAYEILDRIRFDYLSDTMFREYFVRAKRELEGAISDFLLSDTYWEKKIKEHRDLTPKEYDKKLKECTDTQSSK